jgi:hypothetical protein
LSPALDYEHVITVTVQKTRDIGVLKALGARPAQIVFVFLIQGMIIGTVGIALGLGLGLLTVNFRNEFKEWLAHVTGVEIFPPGIYQFSQIPAEMVPSDIMLICVCAFVISSLAALVPAAAAALQDPREGATPRVIALSKSARLRVSGLDHFVDQLDPIIEVDERALDRVHRDLLEISKTEPELPQLRSGIPSSSRCRSSVDRRC